MHPQRLWAAVLQIEFPYTLCRENCPLRLVHLKQALFWLLLLNYPQWHVFEQAEMVFACRRPSVHPWHTEPGGECVSHTLTSSKLRHI
jgi:hypothetical protein